jgi:hypothetical protein
LSRTWKAKTYISFLKKIDMLMSSPWYSDVDNNSFHGILADDFAEEIKNFDLDSLARYYDWLNVTAISARNAKEVSFRVEGNNCSVFGNDLALLQTLETISPTSTVTYTQVDLTIPKGVRYFYKKPDHKYRVYFKSKAVPQTWHAEISAFVKRYKGTSTVVVPSKSLEEWLRPNSVYHQAYPYRYCYASYFLDYDDESTYTLISLFFSDMLRAQFKLEQRPS